MQIQPRARFNHTGNGHAAPAEFHCGTCPVRTGGPCPFRPVVRNAGTVLCAQGDPSKSVYLVRDGLVALSAVERDGAEDGAELLGENAWVGLESLRTSPSPYEARTLSDTRLCVIDPENFQAWVGPPRAPGRLMVDALLAQADGQREIARWRKGPSLGRVARLLVLHGDLVDGSGPILVQKQIVARLLDMRPETLSRCLGRLQDRGIIAGTRTIRVLDPARLLELAEIDDSAAH